ncbi:hypothetical protein [Streptomyces scopuliridis]|uniref:Uncharacterized protein n=1 Tax=Streptomyces scopuliridis TaxID=452529 RepID=A0ACD4ZSP8_9ACTN|nr:hypothetical protein [Streptomyces scopuliridis]WSC01240.1 hypothetical protein OG835_32415 [Streptomyces scopuliridis]
MTTLADAVRAQFERDHPRGKNTLLCVGLCRQRKDREDFRETPWHGRAANYQRFASRLVAEVPRSADVIRAHERPYRAAVERSRREVGAGPLGDAEQGTHGR